VEQPLQEDVSARCECRRGRARLRRQLVRRKVGDDPFGRFLEKTFTESASMLSHILTNQRGRLLLSSASVGGHAGFCLLSESGRRHADLPISRQAFISDAGSPTTAQSLCHTRRAETLRWRPSESPGSTRDHLLRSKHQFSVWRATRLPADTH